MVAADHKEGKEEKLGTPGVRSKLKLGDVAEVAVAVLGAQMDSTFKESQNILSGERSLRIMESNS